MVELAKSITTTPSIETSRNIMARELVITLAEQILEHSSNNCPHCHLLLENARHQFRSRECSRCGKLTHTTKLSKLDIGSDYEYCEKCLVYCQQEVTKNVL